MKKYKITTIQQLYNFTFCVTVIVATIVLLTVTYKQHNYATNKTDVHYKKHQKT